MNQIIRNVLFNFNDDLVTMIIPADFTVSLFLKVSYISLSIG